MNRLSVLLFPALLVVTTVFALNGIAAMPENIAVHFSTTGEPNRWMIRDHYRLLILFILIGLPLLLVWVMAILPRYTNGKGQIPNPEYWFAGERRDSTTAYLITHACWLGCLTVAIGYGLHVLILRANASNPPILAIDRLTTMIIVYLVGLVWWVSSFLRHFRR
jgi:uncharacterized membrane protein